MILLIIVIIGLALSVDAFAVTVSNSCAYPDATKGQRLAMPIIFGAFQGLMPLIGFYAGTLASSFIDTYAGFVALIILGVIGGRMIYSGSKALLTARKRAADGDDPNVCPPTDQDNPHKLSIPILLFQGIASSIDALICGVSFLSLGADIFIAAPLVALITFLCCLAALFLGRYVGLLFGDKAGIVGGVVLILIGIKALF